MRQELEVNQKRQCEKTFANTALGTNTPSTHSDCGEKNGLARKYAAVIEDQHIDSEKSRWHECCMRVRVGNGSMDPLISFVIATMVPLSMSCCTKKFLRSEIRSSGAQLKVSVTANERHWYGNSRRVVR